jgi:hypothetical protein
MARDLDRLAKLWGTDKGLGRHCYTQHYAAHLGRRRGAVEAVLEIGVGGYMDPHHGGHSLFMWRNYFPRATVYGLDLFEKRLDAGARIVTLQADQADPDALQRALSGCPAFDLIVDDGDHVGEHIIVSFETCLGGCAQAVCMPSRTWPRPTGTGGEADRRGPLIRPWHCSRTWSTSSIWGTVGRWRQSTPTQVWC